ncbi:MAG: hypothetical protein WCO99_13140, partial [Planctomycetota bacterium]
MASIPSDTIPPRHAGRDPRRAGAVDDPPAELSGNVMVATNQGSRSSRGRKKAAPEAGVEAAASQPIPVAADAAARNGRSQPRPQRGKPESVTARDAAGRIRLLA